MKKYLLIVVLLIAVWLGYSFYNSRKVEPKVLQNFKTILFTYKNLGNLDFYNLIRPHKKTPSNSLQASQSLCKQRFIDTIIVHKSKRTMQLYQGLKLVKEYKISLGFEPKGHKEEEGDGKTPEGQYKIVNKNFHSKFHKSLKISYPNQKDIAKAHQLHVSAGGDIMIHGLKKEYSKLGRLHLLKDWTHGCIAVTNDEIDEVWNMTPLGTKVLIIP